MIANRVSLPSLTFDEAYGLIPVYLHTLDDRGQCYIGEVPSKFVGWYKPPTIQPVGSCRPGVREGPRSMAIRLAGDIPVRRVDDLCRCSSAFTKQHSTRFHIKDMTKEPIVRQLMPGDTPYFSPLKS